MGFVEDTIAEIKAQGLPKDEEDSLIAEAKQINEFEDGLDEF